MYKRPALNDVLKRLNEKRRFIQILSGPRQTGKTTIARQIMGTIKIPGHYASADEPVLKDNLWIEQQWEIARLKLKTGIKKFILILDEIQKIHNWSETVKRLWDEDTVKSNNIYVILLGSSQLLLQKGLTESLTGRFELIPVTHWPFNEMRKAFNWGIDKYIFYGGYPGSAGLITDSKRWTNYVIESLIETTISKDILMMARVDKPILLRRLFELGCAYSSQILSYQKMLGQLQDAGNTTTLAHYLNLLESAGLLAGLSKYSGQKIRQRGASPKLQILNTGLLSAYLRLSFHDVKNDTETWGRLVESAVGATLANGIKGKNMELFYWSGFNREVDFVLLKGNLVLAIEVKSNRKRTNLPGIELFSKSFKVYKKILVGGQGIPLEDFFSVPPEKWFE